MTQTDPERSPRPRVEPMRAVIDANVFGRGAWIRPIVDAARRGHIDVIWAPCVIAEASRLLTWRWLLGKSGETPDVAWRLCSQAAHEWFDIMSAVFRVMEDAPPHEPLWTETPRDPHDRPIWTSAVRARAHVVVTDNLRDGPPPDERGLRRWGGILYAAPDHVVAALD